MVFKIAYGRSDNMKDGFDILSYDVEGLPEVDNYKHLAAEGDPYSQWLLANDYFYGECENQDYKKAYKLYELSANQDFVYAITNLGFCYSNGLGVVENHKKGFELYLKAAKMSYSS
jgi:TPR repeat protein